MKSKIFLGIMAVISILLFLLRLTGLPVHIVLSVLGAAVLIVFAVLTKKEWKKPLPEILLRVLFAVAFITGILVMKISGIAVIGILHKVSAVLFVLLLLGMYIPKLFKKA